MPKSYNLIEQIVDEMAPFQDKSFESCTLLTIRSLIREALKRYENACMEEAALRGEK